VIGGGSVLYWRSEAQIPVQAGLQTWPEPAGKFTRVTAPLDLRFPRDQGAHPDYQTEWWYYTGNLENESGDRFGFQLTFFRRALVGPDLREARSSSWGVDQVYLANFTITDASSDRFYAYERMERGAVGLAGALGEPGLRVWLQDWRVEQTGEALYHLSAQQDELSLELDLRDLKGMVLEGERGYSRKGPEDGNASTYLSQTRLQTSGTLEIGGRRQAVNGFSWMDHEFSTSALSADQVGWDWFSIQLDDGSELMVYTIRQSDGTLDPYSQGTLIATDGSTRHLDAKDFGVKVLDTWRSPRTGGVYPAAWILTIPGIDITLQIKPIIANQELNLSFIYWEGAVDIAGSRDGKVIHGQGYVELTGYAQSLAGRF
jgi:predicted secreted hydrolase